MASRWIEVDREPMPRVGMRPDAGHLASFPISQLNGVSPADVLALTRVGVMSVPDLLGADFDRVAYLLDSYDRAESIFREAMALAKRLAPAHPRTDDAPEVGDEAAGAGARVGEAITLAIRGLAMEADLAGALRTLAWRLELAARIATDAPEGAAAAIVLDAGEQPDWAARRAAYARALGEGAAIILDHAAGLRVVPVSLAGTGKTYLSMMEEAPRASRLLCAGVALRDVRSAIEGTRREGAAYWRARAGGWECAIWYFRLVVSALRATEADQPIVAELVAALADLERAEGAHAPAAAA